MGLKWLLELRRRRDSSWVLGRGESSLENFCRQSGGNTPDLRSTNFKENSVSLKIRMGLGPEQTKTLCFQVFMYQRKLAQPCGGRIVCKNNKD